MITATSSSSRTDAADADVEGETSSDDGEENTANVQEAEDEVAARQNAENEAAQAAQAASMRSSNSAKAQRRQRRQKQVIMGTFFDVRQLGRFGHIVIRIIKPKHECTR